MYYKYTQFISACHTYIHITNVNIRTSAGTVSSSISPITPGPVPLSLSPWISHADHGEFVWPEIGQQAVAKPYPADISHCIGMPLYQSTGQSGLHVCRSGCLEWWSSIMKISLSGLFLFLFLFLLLPFDLLILTRMEQLMRPPLLWTLRTLSNRSLHFSSSPLYPCSNRSSGSETPPVKSTRASAVLPPSSAS